MGRYLGADVLHGFDSYKVSVILLVAAVEDFHLSPFYYYYFMLPDDDTSDIILHI